MAAKAADSVVATLRRRGTKKVRDGMARYAIPSDKAFGVTVAALGQMAKTLGPDHDLAEALWRTGWYEARMLATMVDDPAQVTAAQMDRWCRDFDNWAICDTACFKLFDRTPHAWTKVGQWAPKREEFVQAAPPSRCSGDSPCTTRPPATSEFLRGLELIERAADRRTELREEGGQHGAALDRQAQPFPQCGGRRRGPPARGLGRPRGPVEREGRAA